MAECMIPRRVVLGGEAMHLKCGEAAFANTGTNSRIWFDSFTMFGVDMGKYLFAYDGDQEVTDVTDVTAACNLIEFYLAGPEQLAGVTIKVGLPISKGTRGNIDQMVRDVKSGANTDDNTLVFGNVNSNQEYKGGDSPGWASCADLSGLVLAPIEAADMTFDIQEHGYLGGATTKSIYYILTFGNMMIDTSSFGDSSIAVVHELTTDQGAYGLLSIDSGATETTGDS